jgi:choline-sulfatase
VLAALDAAGLSATTRVIYTSDHGDNLGNRGMWGKSVLYEDSAVVPLIAVGDGFPMRAEPTPVSLVDIAPTVLAATGVAAPMVADAFDGRSLFEVVRQPDPDRVAFSEYHAVNAPAGQFMLRRGRWKLIHYVGDPPQLFDLEADPAEERNLADDPGHAAILADLDAALRRIVDPDAASAQAFADQAAVIAAHGGEDRILTSCDIPFTPVPAH